MTSSPSQTFIILLIFCSFSIQSQDCSSIQIDYSQISDQGDSLYLNQLLAASETPTTRCTLLKISAQYFSQFDYQQAILFGQALENNYTDNPPSDSNLILKNWEFLSNSYHEMGIPDSVLVYGKKLLFALDRRITTAPKMLPRILEIVAMSFADKLQYDLALEWVDLIGYHLLLEGMQDTELFAGMLYVKGVVRTMQAEIEDASKLMDSIQNLYSEHPLDSKRILARAHTLQIRLNLFLGDQEGLVYHINKAEQLLTESQILDTATYVSFLLNKSYYYLVMEDPLLEKEMTEKALALSRDFKQVPVLWSKVMLFYGANLSESKEKHLAINIGERAIEYISSNTFFKESFISLKSTLTTFLSVQFENQRIIDTTNYDKYTTQAWLNRKQHLNTSYKLFNNGNANLSNLEIGNEEINSFIESLEIFHDYMKISPSEDEALNEAYLFLENFKAHTINYHNLDRSKAQKNKILQNLERELREEISELNQNIHINSLEFETEYKNLLEKLDKRKFYKNLISSQKYKLSNTKGQKVVTLKNVDNQIEDETLISYVFNNNSLFILAINREKKVFEKIKLPESKTIQKKIKILYNYLSNTNYSNKDISLNQISFELYSILIAPIENLLKENVVIIPFNEIFQIPFSVLLSELPTMDSNYKSNKYLLQKYNFSYSPSISSYFNSKLNISQTTSPKSLAIAPEFKNESNLSDIRQGLGKLRYNIQEANMLTKKIPGVLLTGEKSNLSNIKKHYTTANIIHFATHAIPVGQNNQTQLILTDENSSNFKSLTFDEIFSEDLNNSLIVLIACNSGIGELDLGEGMLSITNDAFRHGSPSIISNLWNANDYSMKELFEFFYTNINSGMSISQSLREAKIKYLITMPNEICHPFYWSGLTSYGFNNKAIIKSKTPITILIIILIAILAGFAFLKLIKLKNSQPIST